MHLQILEEVVHALYGQLCKKVGTFYNRKDLLSFTILNVTQSVFKLNVVALSYLAPHKMTGYFCIFTELYKKL